MLPLGINPAFAIKAREAVLEALVDTNSLGVLHAASAAASSVHVLGDCLADEQAFGLKPFA